MEAVVVFAVVLLMAVLLSELASRSILSTAVLFLGAGLAVGPAGLGWLSLDVRDPGVQTLAELALFSVLFTDGMKVGATELRRAWRLPGRALLLGMPLTLVGTAALARWLAHLRWTDALLLGAALAPTDPVFVSAIVSRKEVPKRLRRLLNVESGLNDGLALPIVVGLLAVEGRSDVQLAALLGEIVLGIAFGIVIPAAVLWLEARRGFAAHAVYRSLLAFSIALLVYALAGVTHANEFLAAFAAGVTVASLSEEACAAFAGFGEIVAELLKLAAMLVLGILVTPAVVAGFSPTTWLFVPLVLVVVRPVAVCLALLRSPLDRSERLTAAWFGPKGLASVVYALLILKSGLAGGVRLFHLSAAVIVLSIVAHSSSDVVVARWFQRHGEAAAPDPP